MDDATPAGRRIPLFEPTGRCLLAIVLLAAFGVSVAAGPATTSFVHAVGFSFDYPAKWKLKRVEEGMMLIPPAAGTDAAGRPLELVIIGFVDTAGVTDPFDPTFSSAFENRYHAVVPRLARTGDLDWLKTPMGTGMLVPYEDEHGNEHRLHCAVHGDLGIFLAHVVQSRSVRPSTRKVREIFSSFGWSDSVIDPALVRSWTPANDLADFHDAPEDHWTFATDGRLRRAAEPKRGGFYSSFGGVLNIVWDHGVEESYLYTVSNGEDSDARLELRHPSGDALRFH